MTTKILDIRLENKSSSILANVLWVLGFAGLTALAAKVEFNLPGTPVPITLQTMAVLFSGAFLGSKRGAASQIALIGMGLAGLPVFSRALPGWMVLAGPTGGYILGFVFAAFIVGWIFERNPKLNVWLQGLTFFGSSLFIFIPGVVWLKVYGSGMNWNQVLLLGFLPFLPGDITKCVFNVVAMKAVAGTRRLIRKS